MPAPHDCRMNSFPELNDYILQNYYLLTDVQMPGVTEQMRVFERRDQKRSQPVGNENL